jgi:NADH-quinone oxidoreductase subunit L
MMAIFVVLPFILSGIVAALVNDDRIAGPVTLAAGVASIVMVALLYLNNPGIQAVNWFSAGAYSFTLITSTSQLHMIFLALIAFMSTMVILYSIGFMDVPSEKRGYYSEISFFAAGMMLFAIGADLITLFIGWELIGLASYLLIGFWRYRESAVRAANKAVTVLLIGDILVFAGIALLWSQLHSLSVAYIVANASGSISQIAALLIVAGALTKSAQFPFHEWLTDAMEGPTPVSTLLHSSTMVKAGVFLVAVLLPFLLNLGMGPILVGAGLFSVAIAAVNALSSTHVKKILAYSTIEDMGLMLIALGFNALPAAILLFIFQAFYKGLIFMEAGILTKANKDEMDIRKISGSRRLGFIIPLVIAVASVAGIFPLGGFFGKVAVESAVTNYAVYGVLVLVEVVSSMYIFRWLFVPLAKSKQQKKAEYAAPRSMAAAVYVLAAVVVLSSLAWLYLSGNANGISIGWQNGAVFTAVVLLGLGLSYLLYYSRPTSAAKLRSSLGRISDMSFAFNSIYSLIVGIVQGCGTAVEAFDYYVYAAIKAVGNGFGQVSVLFERTEDGSINYYLAMFVIGIIVAVIIFSVI